MRARGWDEIDILMVSGDAYVDHPAFGPVLVARLLLGRGYRVGLVPQPRWDTVDDVARLGRPRLFVGVSAGNLDSMLNKLTAQKKVRGEDQYSPDGRTNCRPNRASIVYANLCRRAFPGVPIVLGGIEASLRRIAHYDYWGDAVRRSILLDAKADLLVFGMGERAAGEIARRLAAGATMAELGDIRGTAHRLRNRSEWESLVVAPAVVTLPSYETVRDCKQAFARMTRDFQRETNPHNARSLLQPHGQEAVFLNPPALPLDEAELDALYDLPFTRRPHYRYAGSRIPAYETVKHSVVTMRGCFGGCAFCSVTEHEGRVIQSRSQENILREVRSLAQMAGFGGTLTDMGGPTANMYRLGCTDPNIEAKCRRLSCVHPTICLRLRTDQQPLVELLRAVRREPGVRHVFVASGIRYDLANRDPELIREIARHHTGGQLSVAPEHVAPAVLSRMRKPSIEQYERFAREFMEASIRANKEQFLVPYLIVGHPGSTLRDTIELALYLKCRGMRPRQIQQFIPTPMSVATTMYYTGIDPLKNEPVEVVREPRTRRLMKALLYWWDSRSWPLAREALHRAGRRDLIGTGSGYLVPAARVSYRSRDPSATQAAKRAPRQRGKPSR